jgi:hypothetical protein
MSAVWLLPIVTLVGEQFPLRCRYALLIIHIAAVASSTGGNIALAMQSNHRTLALVTSAFSLTMLVIGLSLALMIITIYLMRLIIHGAPGLDLILSVFVALGPLGQGGYSFLVNGQVMGQLVSIHFNDSASTIAGESIYIVCVCAAYLLWSMGVAWIVIACLSLYSRVGHNRIQVPFSVSYWGKEMNSTFRPNLTRLFLS